MIDVNVAISVFNRHELTERLLCSLQSQEGLGEDFRLRVVVLDDGSTNPTPQFSALTGAVDVRVVRYDSGGLFWARGMALAQMIAGREPADLLLWLNNDVHLFPDALRTLFERATMDKRGSIYVGALQESELDETSSYSGFRMRSRRPGDLEMVVPNGAWRAVDAFNGNVVVVPWSSAERIGLVDPIFEHGLGDWDYGLRAGRCGVRSYLSPRNVGICPRNPVSGTWADSTLPRRRRLSLLFDRKGRPFRSQLVFTRRHGSLAWPFWLVAGYVKATATIIAKR